MGLSKAFDTLDHAVLLDKLSSFHVNLSSLQWFKAYLTDRTQSICVNGVISEPQPILFGVPQGSVLGPLLFIMYINDLPLSIRHCDIELYAEDTLLYFASNDTNTIEAKMTSDLENVIQWLHSNFLVLNLSKTKIMLVGTHLRLATVQDFKIKANEVNIERVDQFKYLGVLMDQNLSWNDHISYIGRKIA